MGPCLRRGDVLAWIFPDYSLFSTTSPTYFDGSAGFARLEVGTNLAPETFWAAAILRRGMRQVDAMLRVTAMPIG